MNYTIGVTAINATDYQGIAASATIPAGQASATVTITPIDDVVVEGSETVVLTLTGGANHDVGAQTTATVTISDND